MRPLEPRPDAAEWPEIVVVASGLNALVGLWLVVSALVLPLDPVWNDLIVGALTTVFASLRVAGMWSLSMLSYVNAALGITLAVSGLWVDATSAGAAADTIAGLVIFGLGLLSATASERARVA